MIRCVGPGGDEPGGCKMSCFVVLFLRLAFASSMFSCRHFASLCADVDSADASTSRQPVGSLLVAPRPYRTASSNPFYESPMGLIDPVSFRLQDAWSSYRLQDTRSAAFERNEG